MAITSLSYVIASILLVTAVVGFVRRDAARMETILAAEMSGAA